MTKSSLARAVALLDRLGARVAAWALQEDDACTLSDSLFFALASSGVNVTREVREAPVDGDPDRMKRIIRLRTLSSDGQKMVCYDYDASGRWLLAVRVLPPDALF